jgi:hypothetical protein
MLTCVLLLASVTTAALAVYRVKNIQDEYQKYMERVRAKAQSAIDQANTAYSQQRNVLMSRFDALVAFLTHHQQVGGPLSLSGWRVFQFCKAVV